MSCKVYIRKANVQMGKKAKKPRSEKKTTSRRVKSTLSSESTQDWTEFEAGPKAHASKLKAIHGLSKWMRDRLTKFVKEFGTKESPVLILNSHDPKSKLSDRTFKQPVALIGFGEVGSIQSDVAILFLNVRCTRGVIRAPDFWEMVDSQGVTRRLERNAVTYVQHGWNDVSSTLIMQGSATYTHDKVVVGKNVVFKDCKLNVKHVIFDSSATGIRWE